MRLVCLLLFALTIAFAQADEDTGITVSVSRSLTVPPDQAQFTVNVYTQPGQTVDQVIQALSVLGLQRSDLTGQEFSASVTYGDFLINTSRPSYTFNFARPFDAFLSTNQALATLSRMPPAGYTIQYASQLNTSPTTADEARRGLLPALISDAKSKAQALASAADLTLGRIDSISEAPGILLVAAVRVSGVIGVNRQQTYGITVRFAVR